MPFRMTRDAAREFGVSYWVLFDLIRYDRITPPQKTTSGDYVWTDDDMVRARRVLTERRGRAKETLAAAAV